MRLGDRGLRILAGLVVAAGSSVAPAVADTDLGTTGGLNYISDETGSIPVGSSSDNQVAQCPDDRHVIGGGARIPGFGADAHLNVMNPTTVEGPEGGFGLYFWNTSGAAKTAIAHATCAKGKAPTIRARSKNTESAPDAIAVRASCKPDESVSGGGAYANGPVEEAFVNSSYPTDGSDRGRTPDDGWKVRVQNRAGLAKTVIAFAVCVRRDLVYKSNEVPVDAGGGGGFTIGCGEKNAVSGGARLTGSAGDAVLRALSPYDDLDDDTAPDDGFDVNVANGGGDRTLTRFAICKR